MSEPTLRFRLKVVSPALIFTVWLSVLVQALIALDRPPVIDEAWLVARLLMLVFAVCYFGLLSLLWPIRITSTGIKCPDWAWLVRELRWEQIAVAKHVNLLGFRFLVLYEAGNDFGLWVPLFLRNEEGFWRAIRACVGRDHPIRRCIRRCRRSGAFTRFLRAVLFRMRNDVVNPTAVESEERGMEAIRIYKRRSYGDSQILAVDLIDILRLKEANVRASWWRLANVECVGPLADEFMQLGDEEATVSGEELLRLAAGVDQVIEGDFEAYWPGEAAPWLVVHAVDSTFYEIITKDRDLLNQLKARFHTVQLLRQDAGAS